MKKQPFQFFHRSVSGYAVVVLVMVGLGMIWAFGVIGCGPVKTSGAFFPNACQSPTEVARLLRNAHYYKLMGRPELALKELELAHQQDPDNLQIVNTLAQNYEAMGQFETARKLYKEALTRQPHPALANNLCFTYYLEGRWQEAETCYRQTLARDPSNEAARNNLGLLYCRLGRQDEAVQLWQEAEGNAAAAYKTRQALAALGMSDGAVYVLTHEPSPPVKKESSSPTSIAAVPTPPTTPNRLHTPAEPLAPQKVAMQLPPRTAPEKPDSDDVKPLEEARPQPAPPKASPTPASVSTPRAQTRTRPAPLTCAELLDTAIEVRNGTPVPHFAREMQSLLEMEGFTVAKIGNHIDFGAEKTMVYYRPEAQRVAQALQANMLPVAGMEQTSSLNDTVAIKILLGHDLLKDQELMARCNGEAQPQTAAKMPPQNAKLLATPAVTKCPAPVTQAPRNLSSKNVVSPSLSPAPAALASLPAGPPEPLTATELENTAIEIRNGTRTRYLAHRTRTLLNLDGFTVAKIGNHTDFGAGQTIIYYRPEVKRVAQALGRILFPKAKLEPCMKLDENIAVKILLGADLLEGTQLMARLDAEGK